MPGLAGTMVSYLCFLHSWDDGYKPLHPVFYCLRWDLANFLPGLASNQALLISASQVAMVTGVSHHAHSHGFYRIYLIVEQDHKEVSKTQPRCTQTVVHALRNGSRKPSLRQHVN
jgi:hypothetical protein